MLNELMQREEIRLEAIYDAACQRMANARRAWKRCKSAKNVTEFHAADSVLDVARDNLCDHRDAMRREWRLAAIRSYLAVRASRNKDQYSLF